MDDSIHKIRPITKADLPESLSVIRSSFNTVALEMNLTPGNCPGHTAFTTMEKLIDLHGKAACFGFYANNTQIGFVAAEKVGDGEVYYLDKLAVLPGQRHKGYGAQLVMCVLDYVGRQGGKKVSLGMIDSHAVLKEWYKSLGFEEKGTKKFDHLPFLVCFMDLDLTAQKIE